MSREAHSFFEDDDAGVPVAPAFDLGDVRESSAKMVRDLLLVAAKGRTPTSVGHRTAVLLWLLDPNRCGQKELADRLRISEAAVSKLSREMRIAFVDTVDAFHSRCES